MLYYLSLSPIAQPWLRVAHMCWCSVPALMASVSQESFPLSRSSLIGVFSGRYVKIRLHEWIAEVTWFLLALVSSRKHELPGLAEWMIEQKHKRLYAEDVLRLNDEASAGPNTSPQLMGVAL